LLLKVPAHEKERNDNGDDEANEIVHIVIFSQRERKAAPAIATCAEIGKHSFLMSREAALRKSCRHVLAMESRK
jgi:hypothetical protein